MYFIVVANGNFYENKVFTILQLIRKRTAAIERVKSYLSETIEDHKVTFDPENIRDFIDLYIKASKDESEPELFTGKLSIEN
jgi:hypothetical protein